MSGPGVIGQQESVGGEAGHSLLTAFPYKCGSRMRRPIVREGVRESLADLLRQSLTAKGGNRGCWSGCYGRSAAENITDRRASTAFYMDGGIGTTGGTGHHRLESSTSACSFVSIVSLVSGAIQPIQRVCEGAMGYW